MVGVSKPDRCDETSQVVQPKQQGNKKKAREESPGQKKKISSTKQLQESKKVLGLEQRSTQGGGASPVPSPSTSLSPTSPSLLPGPVDVGGVGAAVDVAVGLQAVLRRSHHVGGFHRHPAEGTTGLRLRTVATARLPLTRAFLFPVSAASHVHDCDGHSLHEDDDVVDLDAGHGAEGAAGREKSTAAAGGYSRAPRLRPPLCGAVKNPQGVAGRLTRRRGCCCRSRR